MRSAAECEERLWNDERAIWREANDVICRAGTCRNDAREAKGRSGWSAGRGDQCVYVTQSAGDRRQVVMWERERICRM
jgi:hypothetical protein